MKYRIDSDKFAVIAALEDRGFSRTYEDDYDIYWAPVSAVQTFYKKYSKQLFSHFPSFHELTRKDLMVKHLKYYKKINPSLFVNFPVVPLTYLLPHESAILARELQQMIPLIMKPAGRSQGKGIHIVRNIQQYRVFQQEHQQELYIASKYIDNPLLIQNKKFDMRIYVLVTSFRPITAYIYQQAFCRFCSSVYDKENDELTSHLTNVAVNQKFDSGTKLSLENLFIYLRPRLGIEKCLKIQEGIIKCIILTLQAVQPSIGYSNTAFELYGFDILIDDQLQIWLMEVNASPSLNVSSDQDRILKCQLLDDLFKVVLKEQGVGDFMKINFPNMQ
ncbi:Tubulin tyrosine ligase [Spironucleus salmonicida]|uniref:Tubulin tyrosine ligase n=1 Tax=Spironucleus salmonicida TaxID=348837 RepID=V6LY70_9EUKA|nr:Tubulin tyrosine ligase [Spironucleus salmonicida]|eukprot:EST49173.1 Tubulin tyrosine ligase [Spironucleus salmonicida]